MKKLRIVLCTALLIALSVNTVQVHAEEAELPEEENTVSEEPMPEENTSVGDEEDPVIEADEEPELPVEEETEEYTDEEVNEVEETEDEEILESEEIESFDNVEEDLYEDDDDLVGGNDPEEADDYVKEDPNISGAYNGLVKSRYRYIVRGLTDDNKDEICAEIEKYIRKTMSSWAVYKMTDDDFVDAEKYNTQVNGYDQELCWAAAAANILWTTGYAQQAKSPYSKKAFSSVDEVMTYFSENFTDYTGAVPYGFTWFTSGKYILTGINGTAQKKKDNSGARLSNVDFTDRTSVLCVQKDPEKISRLEGLEACGTAALIRWLNEDTGKLSSAAHWLTVVGVIIDETVEAPNTGRYKAIILANPDNSSVNGDLTATRSSKLKKKTASENDYIIYRLKYLEKYKMWAIKGYSSTTTAVITNLFTVLDSDVEIGGWGDVENDDVDIYDLLDHDYEINEEGNADAEAEEIVETAAESTVVPEVIKIKTNVSNTTTAASSCIKQATNTKTQIVTLSAGLIEADQNFEAYTTGSNITSVYIDDKTVPTSQYKVSTVKNGYTRVVIDGAYLQKLTKGVHNLRMQFTGGSYTVRLRILPELYLNSVPGKLLQQKLRKALKQ